MKSLCFAHFVLQPVAVIRKQPCCVRRVGTIIFSPFAGRDESKYIISRYRFCNSWPVYYMMRSLVLQRWSVRHRLLFAGRFQYIQFSVGFGPGGLGGMSLSPVRWNLLIRKSIFLVECHIADRGLLWSCKSCKFFDVRLIHGSVHWIRTCAENIFSFFNQWPFSSFSVSLILCFCLGSNHKLQPFAVGLLFGAGRVSIWSPLRET